MFHVLVVGICPDLNVVHFQDDEYAIYDVNQQRIRYIIEFTTPADKVQKLVDISLVHEDEIDNEEVLKAENKISKYIPLQISSWYSVESVSFRIWKMTATNCLKIIFYFRHR